MEQSKLISLLKDKIASLSAEVRDEVKRYLKEYIRNNTVSDWRRIFPISIHLYIYKSGIGLLTHYDLYNSKPSSLDRLNEKLSESLLNG